MQTRSQKYAKQVYEKIELIKELDVKDRKRYGKRCHDFPFIVRENGLVAAFGFLAAKGKEKNSPENRLLEHYTKLLKFSDSEELHKKLTDADLAEYSQLTKKTLQLAEWFKRYAEGVLKVDSTGESTDKETEK